MCHYSFNAAIVVCTYNPDETLFARCLSGIAQQKLRPKSNVQVIIIDNNSDRGIKIPPTVSFSDAFHLSVIRESRQGLLFARLRAISALDAPLAIFVDDDNILSADYLQNVIDIFDAQPSLGAIGGRTHLPEDARVSGAKEPFLGYLGIRDYGDEVIQSDQDSWGPWEPIGAGMAVRTEVCRKFQEFVEHNSHAAKLGRSAGSLNSCEDSLMARIASRNGYFNAYRPELELVHAVIPDRFQWRYLFRLLLAMGRSAVTLETVLRGQPALAHFPRSPLRLLAILPYRLASMGVPGICQWAWDVGAYLEARKLSRRARDTSRGDAQRG